MPFADSDGTPIAWDEAGPSDGETVLLIQGLGFAGEMWYRLVPHLVARGFRVLTIDNRGTGKTGAPPGPYFVEQMAKDAEAVLDAAGVDRAHIVGISMGGLILQQLASTSPQRFKTAIFSATSAGDPEVAIAMAPEVAEALAARASLPPRESIELLHPYAYSSKTPKEWIDEDTERRLANPITTEGYLNQIGGASQYQASADRLRALQMPVLVVHGTDDGMVAVKNAEILVDLIPGAELHIFDGAGHVLMTDVPEEYATAIADFADRHR